jgi:hypothetical protein
MWKLAKVAAAVVVGALGLFATSQAQAGTLTGTVEFGPSYNWAYAGGGEFSFKVTPPSLTNLTAVVPSDGSIWATFCLEKNENLQGAPSTYDAVVNTKAMNGGIAGGSPDPLSRYTAYLYSEFLGGSLTGYTYVAGAANVASAKALQNVIWYLENEISSISAGTETAFYGDAIANAGPDIGYIRVLNLTQKNAAGTVILRQDILAKTTDAFVPVPAAAWMGLALLGGAGAVRMIRRRQA